MRHKFLTSALLICCIAAPIKSRSQPTLQAVSNPALKATASKGAISSLLLPSLPAPFTTNGLSADALARYQAIMAARGTNAPVVVRKTFPCTNVIPISGIISGLSFAYVIQRTTNLASGIWRDVAIFNNANAPSVWLDTNAPPIAFYRGATIPFNPSLNSQPSTPNH